MTAPFQLVREVSVTQVRASSLGLQGIEPGPVERATRRPVVTKEDVSKSQSYLLQSGPLSEVVSSPNPETFKGRLENICQ